MPCHYADFSILMRHHQFFQHKNLKSSHNYWQKVFIIVRELLITFNWQQQLTLGGESPKFTLEVSNCSCFLLSATLEERFSTHYSWPELTFNLNLRM